MTTHREPASRRPLAATEVAIALGSNMPHGRHGPPRQVLRAAVARLQALGLQVRALSPVIETAPVGPSRRRYANAVLRGFWTGSADALLLLLKGVEKAFGRRPGVRWGKRVLDCDLLAFGSEQRRRPGLCVPHPRMQERDFVLTPFAAVWPDWRHPRLNETVRQMRARLKKPRPKKPWPKNPQSPPAGKRG